MDHAKAKPRLDFNLYDRESSSQVLSQPDSSHQPHDSSSDTHHIINLPTTHHPPHTQLFHSLVALTTPHRLLPQPFLHQTPTSLDCEQIDATKLRVASVSQSPALCEHTCGEDLFFSTRSKRWSKGNRTLQLGSSPSQ